MAGARGHTSACAAPPNMRCFVGLLSLLATGLAFPQHAHAVDSGSIAGAARRGNFTVGGQLSVAGRRATGEFMILVHPDPAAGEAVEVVCRYTTFSSVEFGRGTASFDATGVCTVLWPTGAITSFDAANRFGFRNGRPDTIDVNFLGSSGVAVPGGTVDWGDFTIVAP